MVQHPYANFKTAHFVKYLSYMLTDFHEISITGIFLDEMIKMRGKNPMLNSNCTFCSIPWHHPWLVPLGPLNPML